MARYHISPDTGRPNQCRASVRGCPIGGENEHFATKEEARAAFEVSQKDSEIPQSLKKTKVKTEPKYVKVDVENLSPNKTWTVVSDNGDTIDIKEVKKNKNGEFEPVGDTWTVDASAAREVKPRNRGANSKQTLPKPSEVKTSRTKPSEFSKEEVDHAWNEIMDEQYSSQELSELDDSSFDPNEEDVDYLDDWDADIDETRMYESDGCDQCGEDKPDIRFRVDPWDLAVHGEENWRNLCNDCYEELRSESY